MRGATRLLFAALACAAIAGCVTLPDDVAAEFRPPGPADRASYGAAAPAGIVIDAADRAADATTTSARHEIDVASLPLEHGQIIVSEAGGAMSLLYGLFAVEDAPWVHAGIVAIEDGRVVVYDANGTFFPVPGVAPTATISGAVRRIGVERFVAGKRIVGLYEPAPRVDRERMVAFARTQWQRGVPFDAYFDTDDAAALYCTELVALALAEGGVTIDATAVRTSHPSLEVARRWLRLRSDHVFLAGKLVASARPVGRWSPDLSVAQIDAYFAAKGEVHRRFDAETRLGHVFEWSGVGIRLRPSVRAFFDAAVAADAAGADRPEAHEVLRRVQALARDRFDAKPSAVAIGAVAPPP